jgi:hypothetical protein
MNPISRGTQATAITASLLAPPLITYLISSMMGDYGLDIFSVMLIEALGFGTAVSMLRPRPWNAILAGLLYFPTMFIVIFLIGYQAGYYYML